MSLLTRKRTILAKIESTYGTDPTPTGSANAMLVKNLEFNPIQADLVSRDLIRPYLGVSERLLATKFVQANFEVEAAGAGAAGLVPGYGPLMRACGFEQIIDTASITISRTGSVATVSLTAHGYAVGDRVVIAGCTETEYNGTQTIVTVPNANSFTYAVTGSPASPATGTPVVNTQVRYKPVSENFESVTLYCNVDGVLHKATGCRGSVEMTLAVKQIPVFKFNFTGLYVSPADVAAPSTDFSSFQVPYLANTQNTPGFSLFGYSALLESASLNLSNSIEYITLIGAESVKLLDRQPAGTLVFEAPTITAKDFFSIVEANTLGVMTLSHGPRTGHKVIISCPSVNLGNPSYTDSNGIVMMSAPFTAAPTSAGNDEVIITIR
jgi:hypothetical protein